MFYQVHWFKLRCLHIPKALHGYHLLLHRGHFKVSSLQSRSKSWNGFVPPGCSKAWKCVCIPTFVEVVRTDISNISSETVHGGTHTLLQTKTHLNTPTFSHFSADIFQCIGFISFALPQTYLLHLQRRLVYHVTRPQEKASTQIWIFLKTKFDSMTTEGSGGQQRCQCGCCKMDWFEGEEALMQHRCDLRTVNDQMRLFVSVCGGQRCSHRLFVWVDRAFKIV